MGLKRETSAAPYVEMDGDCDDGNGSLWSLKHVHTLTCVCCQRISTSVMEVLLNSYNLVCFLLQRLFYKYKSCTCMFFCLLILK